jgi:hypothetical protein
MNPELSSFAAHLKGLIANGPASITGRLFDGLALELFQLQFRHNDVYQKICRARGQTPEAVRHWVQIPAVPTSAFKELELTCLPPAERTAVFHSSGTTEQKPSRHFHGAESLALYETSLWAWFQPNCGLRVADDELICLTPPSEQAPNSSLVHMFETIWQRSGGASVRAGRSPFYGRGGSGGAWTLDFESVLAALGNNAKSEIRNPKLILGTAFSFVHLLDHLAENKLKLQLPPGSRVMETGGYKNRSRSLPKAELHALITEWLGVTPGHIICEYGMSELSSQAYDSPIQNSKFGVQNLERQFRFPPWARAQIVSPETGREVTDGETGLIRIFDLANVFSVAAIQTEDLGVRRGQGFELVGRASSAESRGCSLMSA